jgi:hypothetical protein
LRLAVCDTPDEWQGVCRHKQFVAEECLDEPFERVIRKDHGEREAERPRKDTCLRERDTSVEENVKQMLVNVDREL